MESDLALFVVDVAETGSEAVVSITGEIDLATAPTLRDVFIGLVARGVHTVTLNMAGIGFIDSTGLGVLVSALKRFRANGGDLALQCPRPAAMEALEITGLTKVFTIT